MKKVALILLSCILLTNICMAQNSLSRKAFSLSNGLWKLWNKGKTKKAVSNSLSLYDLNTNFFQKQIHSSLAGQLKENRKCHAYLQQLYDVKNKDINKVISSIYLWSKAIDAKSKADFDNVLSELYRIIADSSISDSRDERYILLCLRELDNKSAINADTKKDILLKNIEKLKSFAYITELSKDDKINADRSWHRYLLSYSLHELYSLDTSNIDYLKQCSYYSTDYTDIKHDNRDGYLYDKILLSGNNKGVDYKMLYVNYLKQNKKYVQVTNALAEMSFVMPSDRNMNLLRESYSVAYNDTLFSKFWLNYLDKKAKPLPNIKLKAGNEILDFQNKPNKWIYICIWTSWDDYSKEYILPQVQSAFHDNQNNSNVKIYSFTVNSQGVDNIMQTNKFSFPVEAISQKMFYSFNVSGYPLSILITPNGKYIEITTNIKTAIKNYSLSKK